MIDKKSDPLEVLLKVKSEEGFQVDDDLIRACYKLQSDHQYDKDRDTERKMKVLVESSAIKKEGSKLL